MMRIISGEFGGRRLKAVPGRATRPTTDKIKEAVFNIIGPYFNGGNALDLFAGSGGLGIEAASRGMQQVVLVDRQYAAIKTIKANITVTKMPQRFRVIKANAMHALHQLAAENNKFDLVLLDPPYQQQKITANMAALATQNLLATNAQLVCETNAATVLPVQLPAFRQLRRQTYGTTAITIYQYGGTHSVS